MEMAGFWSWVIMAAWTIGLFVLAWWFYMPNPMDRDKKSKKKS
ncbi:MAG: hypothetical protein ACREIG_01265 [Nitrospiraceae bacterium]